MSEVQVLTRWIDPTIKQLQKENKQLKERIYKAIEYIENHKEYISHSIRSDWVLEYNLDNDNLEELLEILKGGDEI